MKKILGLIMGLLLLSATAFAANGDLIVDGNLGVGTTSPVAQLHVLGAMGQDNIYFGSGTLPTPTNISTGSRGSFVGKAITSDYRLTLQDGSARVNEYWNAYYDSAAATHRYQVTGEPAVRMAIGGGTTGTIRFAVAPSGNAGDPIVWTEGLFVNNSGNIGIGTTAPRGVLDVYNNSGTSNAWAYIYNNTGANPSTAFNAGMALGWNKSNSQGESLLVFGTGLGSLPRLEIGEWNGSTYAADMVIAKGGKIGIGTTSPSHKLQVCGTSGCSYNEGGLAWINASSREYKKDIHNLSAGKAIETLSDLKPVTFKYKAVPDQTHVGFIAEDVPDLVAMKDRKGLSAMDIVAVLTKVVQEQQKEIEQLKSDMAKMKSMSTIGEYSR